MNYIKTLLLLLCSISGDTQTRRNSFVQAATSTTNAAETHRKQGLGALGEAFSPRMSFWQSFGPHNEQHDPKRDQN